MAFDRTATGGKVAGLQAGQKYKLSVFRGILNELVEMYDVLKAAIDPNTASLQDGVNATQAELDAAIASGATDAEVAAIQATLQASIDALAAAEAAELPTLAPLAALTAETARATAAELTKEPLLPTGDALQFLRRNEDDDGWELAEIAASSGTHFSEAYTDSTTVYNLSGYNLAIGQRVRFHSRDNLDRAVTIRPVAGTGKTALVNGVVTTPDASGNVTVTANEVEVWQDFAGSTAGTGATYIWTKNATPAAASSVTYLIEAEPSDNGIMSIATGQNWQQIEAEFTEVRIDLTVSDSGRSHIVPESVFFRPAYLRHLSNGGAGSGFAIHDGHGVRVWVNPISLADRSLVYQQSSGDTPANGRVRFNLVGIR